MSNPPEISSDATFVRPDIRSVPRSAYLEQVTTLLLRASDSRSRALLEATVNAYFAPIVQMRGFLFPGVERSIYGSTWASSRQAYIDNVLAFAEEYILHVRAHNVSALVDEANGTAKVFATVTAVGPEEESEGLRYESVLIYHFERKGSEATDDEEWKVRRLEFMRGPGTYFLEGGWRS